MATCSRCLKARDHAHREHTCKDIAARLKRQDAQVDAVEDILMQYGHKGPDRRTIAISIVGKLNRLGITGD